MRYRDNVKNWKQRVNQPGSFNLEGRADALAPWVSLGTFPSAESAALAAGRRPNQGFRITPVPSTAWTWGVADPAYTRDPRD